MNTRSARIGLMTIAILASLALTSGTAQAQCNTLGLNTGLMNGNTTVLTRTLAASYFCQSVPSQMNAVDCIPGAGGANTMYLTADAMVATVGPKCQWSCACGTVTIDAGDGLPVELLRFGVE